MGRRCQGNSSHLRNDMRCLNGPLQIRTKEYARLSLKKTEFSSDLLSLFNPPIVQWDIYPTSNSVPALLIRV